MDKQKCHSCQKSFDFDKGGLESSFGYYVCSSKCAKKATEINATAYAIHDKTGAIVETNAKEGE